MSLKKKIFNRLARLSVVFFSLVFLALAVWVVPCRAQEEFPWEMFLPAITNSTFRLSPAQATFIREVGYPQQFTKIFSYEGGEKRVDEYWVYSQHRVIESFINGIFVNETSFTGTYAIAAPSRYRPEHFHHHTTIQNILSKYGQPAKIKQATVWNGILKTYVYPFMYLTFNNDQLVSVTALR